MAPSARRDDVGMADGERSVRSMTTATTKRVWWVLPPLFAVLAVGVAFIAPNLSSSTIDARIVRVIDDDRVLLRWSEPNGDIRQLEATVPREYAGLEVVPIRLTGNDEVEIGSPGLRGLSWQAIAVVGGLAAFLGLVVAYSLAGYGFVRGVGEPGSMTPEEVREDRGFYWRS